MKSMIDVRRRILQDTPHVESASGSGIVSFNTNMGGVLDECIVNFSPVQSGSGDPAPDNVRPITGWNSIGLSGTQPNNVIVNWMDETGVIGGGQDKSYNW